jgi:hypothetical protein
VTVRAAQIVSVIFHPLLLTTYLVLLVGHWMPAVLLVRQEHLLLFAGFVFGITFLLPALNLLLFRQFGVVTSWTMASRNERILPFVFTSILYVLIAGLFAYKVHLSTNFTKLMMIVAALAVAGTALTFLFKISVHSLSWAGLVGIVLPLNRAAEGTLLLPTAILILVTGIVMTARLRLNAHTVREVMVGGLAGFVVGFAGMRILF